MSEREKIKSTILRQLEYGASCRIHLHREVCQELGLSIVPEVNPISRNRTRISKGISDSRLNRPFNELRDDGLIRKVHPKTGVYAFYELTRRGREVLSMPQNTRVR